MRTLSNRITMLVLAIFIMSLIISPTTFVNAETTDDKTSNEEVKIAEIVYEGDPNFLSENADDYEDNDDTVNFQLVVLSPEDQSVDIDKVLDDVNKELSEENKPVHLRPVEDNQNDDAMGYLTNDEGEILPLDINDKANSKSESINKTDIINDIDTKINDSIVDQKETAKVATPAAATPVAYINVSLSTSKDSDKNRVKATITRTVGTLPSPATLTLQLQNRLTGESFVTKKEKTINLKTTKSGSVKYGTTKSRIWRARVTGKLGIANVDYNTYSYIYNKKCIRYPSCTEPYTRKKIYVPPTNLKVDQKKRDNSFRNKYIANFKKKNPNAKINWSSYQIHHMRPLKYGGSNALSNGIAVTEASHTKLTSWWSSY